MKTRLLIAAVALAATSAANASDLLGVYVGAGATRSEIGGDVPATPLTSGVAFDESDTGWKAFVGIRALSMFGAELEYVDLGSASVGSGNSVANADLKSTGVFGLFWLPIPAPLVDVYVKAGYSRLNGSLDGRSNGVAFSRSLDDDVAAAGAGAQVKLGSWALRGDYERFFASGSDPHVISLSVVKFFL